MNSFYLFRLFFIEIYLMVSIFIYNIIYLYFSYKKKLNFLLIKPKIFGNYCLILLINLIFLIILYEFKYNDINIKIDFLLFNNQIILNDYIFIFKYLLILLIFIIIFLSLEFIIFSNIKSFEFYLLIIILILASCFIISSNDFLLLFISLELNSFIFFILISYKTNDSKTIEAGIKYWITNACSTGIFLLGIGFLYGFTSILNFSDLLFFLRNFYFDDFFFFIIILAIIFIFLSFFFKLGIFPFHLWIPDVYEGSNTLITLLLTTVSKLTYLIIFINLFLNLFNDIFQKYFYILFFICSFLSIFISAFSALNEKIIKRIIGYSSINNMGLILLSLSLATEYSISYSLLYLIIYLILNINFFFIILNYYIKSYISKEIYKLFEFFNFSKNNILNSFFFSLVLFSFIGIPPLSGFIGKLAIVDSFIKEEFFLLSFFILLLGVISSFYYLKLVYIMNFYIIIKAYYKNFYFFSNNLFYKNFFFYFFIFINIFLIFFINMVNFLIENCLYL